MLQVEGKHVVKIDKFESMRGDTNIIKRRSRAYSVMAILCCNLSFLVSGRHWWLLVIVFSPMFRLKDKFVLTSLRIMEVLFLVY